jgi:pilus assembly protein Flp/PilA
MIRTAEEWVGPSCAPGDPSVRAGALGVRFARDVRGSTAIEYALIGALIFLVAAGSIRAYVSRMTGVYSQISSAVTQNN